MTIQPVRLAVSRCDHDVPLHLDCGQCLLAEIKARTLRAACTYELLAEVLLLAACLMAIGAILLYQHGWFSLAGALLAGVWL